MIKIMNISCQCDPNVPRLTLLLGEPLELRLAGLKLLVVFTLLEGLLPLPRDESVLSEELFVILVLVSVWLGCSSPSELSSELSPNGIDRIWLARPVLRIINRLISVLHTRITLVTAMYFFHSDQVTFDSSVNRYRYIAIALRVVSSQIVSGCMRMLGRTCGIGSSWRSRFFVWWRTDSQATIGNLSFMNGKLSFPVVVNLVNLTIIMIIPLLIQLGFLVKEWFWYLPDISWLPS